MLKYSKYLYKDQKKLRKNFMCAFYYINILFCLLFLLFDKKMYSPVRVLMVFFIFFILTVDSFGHFSLMAHNDSKFYFGFSFIIYVARTYFSLMFNCICYIQLLLFITVLYTQFYNSEHFGDGFIMSSYVSFKCMKLIYKYYSFLRSS